MAELPRYKSSGLQVAVPEGQFRDVSAPMDALSKGMNQMTSFFMQSAQEQAVVEGEKYGAENAPTVEQLKLMTASGETIKPVGDTFTVFGQSAQKASAEIVSTRIGYAASAELEKIKSNIESGASGSQAGLQQFNAAIKGYSSALAAYDPVAGKKLEAELAYKSNQLYLAASKRAASSISAAAKDEIEQDLVFRIDTIGSIVGSGDSLAVGPAGETLRLSLKDKKAMEFKKIVLLASKVGNPAFTRTTVDAFEKEWKDQSKAVASIWATDPEKSRQRINQLRSGTVDDPAIQSILDSLDVNDRLSVITTTINLSNQYTGLERSQEAEIAKQQKAQIKLITDNFYSALNVGNTEGAKSEWNKINSLDLKKAGDLKKLLDLDVIQKDDDDTLTRLTQDYFNGTLTSDEILQAFSEKSITRKTLFDFEKRLKASEKEEIKAAINYLKRDPKIGFNSFNKDLARRKIAAIEQKLLSALVVDPNLDTVEFVKKEISSTGTSIDTDYQNESKLQLRKFATENSVSVKDGMYRVNDLDAAIKAKTAATADPAELERLGKLGQAISSLRAGNIMGIE
jgi:hypothetical protein